MSELQTIRYDTGDAARELDRFTARGFKRVNTKNPDPGEVSLSFAGGVATFRWRELEDPEDAPEVVVEHPGGAEVEEDVSLPALRRELFETMRGLRTGKVDVAAAAQQARVAEVVLDSCRVTLDATRLACELEDSSPPVASLLGGRGQRRVLTSGNG